ncbi:MAG: undecaprenyl-diphosphate phosphatase [Oscillospiraceae bacterium]|nr:undecaprenyl-diphosphate phosphatase [Oscillospiraceae bacterium]
MSLLHSILLGIIQGVTEFLPISSSGHLAIAEHLLGMEGAAEIPAFFDVLLHLGTLVAVFAAYWGEIAEIVREFFRGCGDLARGTTPKRVPPARRMILLIVAGTMPLLLVLPVKDKVEALSENLLFIGGALLFTGALLFLSDRARKGGKTEKNARLADALLVGAAQAVATCPGVSRSGMTISAGCFLGFERRFAVRYSFLLSIPAILGANLLALKDALETGVAWGDVPVYLAGVAVAAAVGYACIRLLRYIADKGRFGVFAYYCWAVGALVLALTLTR